MLHKLNSAATLIQRRRTITEAPRDHMCATSDFDVHRTIPKAIA